MDSAAGIGCFLIIYIYQSRIRLSRCLTVRVKDLRCLPIALSCCGRILCGVLERHCRKFVRLGVFRTYAVLVVGVVPDFSHQDMSGERVVLNRKFTRPRIRLLPVCFCVCSRTKDKIIESLPPMSSMVLVRILVFNLFEFRACIKLVRLGVTGISVRSFCLLYGIYA